MPYHALPVRFIDAVVSNAAAGATVAMQKPRFHTLLITQDIAPASPTYGEVVVKATYSVEICAATEGGGLGPRLPQGKAFSDYPVTLVGDNDCGVYFDPTDLGHPRTGQTLYLRGDRDPAEWQQVLDTAPEPVTRQGNLLREMLHQAGAEGSAMPPVVIAQMLVSFIRQADTEPGSLIANKFLL